MLPVEEYYAYNLKVMWDFEGILRYSPIFYGYYSDKVKTSAGYRIPLAYFCAGMAVYIFRQGENKIASPHFDEQNLKLSRPFYAH